MTNTNSDEIAAVPVIRNKISISWLPAAALNYQLLITPVRVKILQLLRYCTQESRT